MNMRKVYALAAVALALLSAGCEHINFEFDWGMLAKSVVSQFHRAGE
jgi:hypothetical protein